MKRFFIREDQINGSVVTLDAHESHHLKTVLRLVPGDQVELLDRRGAHFTGTVLNFDCPSKPCVMVEIGGVRNGVSKRGVFTVGVGVIKVKKMELVLQKCTELGVDKVVPVINARCQGNLIHQYSGKGTRFAKIITEACKQCGRAIPLEVAELTSYDAVVSAQHSADTRILFWEGQQEEESLDRVADTLQDEGDITLLFGPEGGLTADEVELARKNDYHIVQLGPRILRAETAVIAAVSIVQHYRGNM